MTDTSAPAATATRAIAGALIRTLLKVVGTALVTRGIIDQSSADGLVPIVAEQLAGTVLVAGAAGWSVFRAWVAHYRWADAWAKLRARFDQ